MIVVVASRVDDEARALVADFPAGQAALVTPLELSTDGWCAGTSESGGAVAVEGGAVIPTTRISGVVTLMPCVFARELTHIDPVDREYTAGEMTSFLTYWLGGLKCPVLNRPTTGCLSGPNWRIEQWLRLAHQIGLPVVPCARSTASPGSAVPNGGAPVSVALVGDAVLGSDDDAICAGTRQLARAAGVDMLAATCDIGPGGARFAGVHAFPDIGSPEVRRAIVAWFLAKG